MELNQTSEQPDQTPEQPEPTPETEWTLPLTAVDRAELVRLGAMLDTRPAVLGGQTVATSLAESLLRIRTREGKIEPLIANAAQSRFEQRRGQRNIVLKARQLGMTTWTAGRFFLKTITQPGTLTLQVAHTQESAEEIFRIVHRFLDELPDELRYGPLETSRVNVRQIAFPHLDSQYCIVSAGERNAGRGMTVQNLHCSELARWPGHPADILAGLRAAMAPDGEIILESTPQGVGGCFYDEWQGAPETGTVRHFFPWWIEDRYRTRPISESALTDIERDLILRHGLDRQQIAYRRRIRANFRGLAAQEYAEDDQACFLSSGDAVFELAAIEARLKDVPEPIEQHHNGEFQRWLPPVSGRSYLVSVDPAGGGSEGDFSAAQVLDLDSGLQCAEFAGHVGNLELARLVTDLATEYNHAWLAIERNNHGSGILAHAEAACGYTKIYCQNGQPGWLTTSVSRPAILGQLGAALVEHPQAFMSRRFLIECRSFVRHPDGRAAAMAGTHDDLVMAMAVGLGARKEILENSL